MSHGKCGDEMTKGNMRLAIGFGRTETVHIFISIYVCDNVQTRKGKNAYTVQWYYSFYSALSIYRGQISLKISRRYHIARPFLNAKSGRSCIIITVVLCILRVKDERDISRAYSGMQLWDELCLFKYVAFV